MFMGLSKAMDSALATGNFDSAMFANLASPHLSSLSQTILNAQPTFEAIQQAIEMVRLAIYGEEDLEEALEQVANGTYDLINTIEDLTKTIDDWIGNLALSDLAPVQSAEAWQRQYQANLAEAMTSLDEAVIRDFLSFSEDYLDFMKSYGTTGTYNDIYNKVLSDVTGVQSNILSQMPTGGSGGLTSGLTFAGESGPEWIVPTYEPQKSSFLKDVGADPETIGKTIAKYLNGGSNGPINVVVQIDGREIGNVVAKQVPFNDDLQRSIRRAAR